MGLSLLDKIEEETMEDARNSLQLHTSCLVSSEVTLTTAIAHRKNSTAFSASTLEANFSSRAKPTVISMREDVSS